MQICISRVNSLKVLMSIIMGSNRNFNSSTENSYKMLVKEGWCTTIEQMAEMYQVSVAQFIPLFVTSLTTVKQIQDGFQDSSLKITKRLDFTMYTKLIQWYLTEGDEFLGRILTVMKPESIILSQNPNIKVWSGNIPVHILDKKFSTWALASKVMFLAR